MMNKSTLFLFLAWLISSVGLSQEVLPIESTDNYTISGCGSPTRVSLDEFSAGDTFSLEIINDASDDLVIVVNPVYFNQDWNLPSSQLLISTGDEFGLELAGVFSSDTHPDGFLVNLESPIVQLNFESSGSGSGFELLLYCASDYEQLPKLKAEVQTENSPWYYNTETESIEIGACQDQELSLNIGLVPLEINAEIPDTVYFKWWMGDGTIYEGINLYEVLHTYETDLGKILNVWFWADTIAPNNFRSVVKLSERPDFSINFPMEEICLNEQFELLGGMQGSEITGATPTTAGEVEITEFYGATRYLPDGSGELYTTSVSVEGFDEGMIIDDQTLFKSICLNMEHSYLGDLEAWITCPSGQSALLFDSYGGEGIYPGVGFGGGLIFLGDANDGQEIIPGIGFNYCFSDDTELGTLEDEYYSGNFIEVNTFQEGNAMAEGTYLPATNFANAFTGCPLNGEWTVLVADNLSIDDGYIFEWYIAFEALVTPEIYEYEIGLTNAEWEENPWFVGNTDDGILVQANTVSSENFSFNVTDDVGCLYSEEGVVSVKNTSLTVNEDSLCVSFVLPWLAENGSISLSSGNESAIEITESQGLYVITSSEAGAFEFAFEDFDCDYETTANLIFLEETDPTCLLSTEKMILRPQLKVFPNPANSISRLEFNLSRSEILTLTIYSPTGQSINTRKISGNPGENSILLKTENLASGLYLIALEGESVYSTISLAVR